MAVSTAEVGSGVDTRIFDVIATADADTTATIAHGFQSTPEYAILTWLTPAAASARLSLWTAALDATNVVLTKATTAGSGNAAAQVRVVVKRRVTADR